MELLVGGMTQSYRSHLHPQVELTSATETGRGGIGGGTCNDDKNRQISVADKKLYFLIGMLHGLLT